MDAEGGEGRRGDGMKELKKFRGEGIELSKANNNVGIDKRE